VVTHNYHPASLKHGLADGCPRCKELAENPARWLDRDHLAAFWALMLRVEYDHPGIVVGLDPNAPAPPDRYRSDLEAKCCRNLARHAEFLLCLGINPRHVMPGTPYRG